MSWAFFAFLSALLVSLASLVEKRVLAREHAFEFVAALAVVNAAFSVPFFFIGDFSALSWPIVFFIGFLSLGTAAAFLLVAKGVRHLEVGVASPFLALTPALTTTLAFFFLDERLRVSQLAGIGLILVGVYVLEMSVHHDILAPLRMVWSSRYIHYLFGALLIYGSLSLVDRIVLAHYHLDPLAFIAIAHVFIAFFYVVIAFLWHGGVSDIRHGLRVAGNWIIVMALLTIGYRLAQSYAIRDAYVGLATALKHTSALFTTVIGGELFHEANVRRHSLAALIIVAGVILVVVAPII